MKKISVKIFLILMVAFICILGISMKLNIDAQISLYTRLLIEGYQYDQKDEDIKKLFPYTSYSSATELEKKVSEEIKTKEFSNKLKSLSGGTQDFVFFVTKNEPETVIYEQDGATFELSNPIVNKIRSYSLGADLEDNFLYFLNSEGDKYETYSLKHFDDKQKESILKNIQNYKTDREEKEDDIIIDYCLEGQDIVYLKIAEKEYGVKHKDTREAFLARYSILGQHRYYDSIQSRFDDFNINDMKTVVTEKLGHANAGSDYSVEIIKNGDLTYSLQLSRYHGYSDTDGVAYGTIVVVNVVKDLEGYVIKTYFEENMWLYVGAFFIAMITSWILSYMIAKPIRKIEQAALQISNQDFETPVVIKSKDEVGSLAKSIDSMRVQLKETIENLKQEIDKVKELESLRKDFVNQFTHEMKTPLGIINGYSELIEEAENQQEIDKYLCIINRETNTINELIQSMLKLSRLEAGKIELCKEMFDLEESVIHIIDEYEVLLMKKNIRVQINTLNNVIDADKKLIETVMRNFLSNAIKHTEENHQIIITIDKGVSIYNQGKHIPEKQLQYIWHTFVTHDQKGSGLGLAICQSILELHHFEYGVENQEQGVCFMFKAPENSAC